MNSNQEIRNLKSVSRFDVEIDVPQETTPRSSKTGSTTNRGLATCRQTTEEQYTPFVAFGTAHWRSTEGTKLVV